MTEPDVTLTDYLLAVECGLFAALLARLHAAGPLRAPFAAFFTASSVAALAGGTVHGFFLGDRSLAGVLLWRAALLAIGVAAWCGWTIGARLLFAPRLAARVQAAAAVAFAVYAVIVIAVLDRFWVAIAHYAPAVVFLVVAMAAEYRREPRRPLAMGLIGLGLTIAAALVQRFEVALHPVFFNHNALYHLVQAGAFFLIYVAGRDLAARPRESI